MWWLIWNYNSFKGISIIATTEYFLQCALGKDRILDGCFILKLCHLYIGRRLLTSCSATFHLHSKNSTSNIWDSSLLIWGYTSLDLGPCSSICLLMLCHSIAWVWQRTGAQFGGGDKEREIEGLVDFPMKLPKLPQTCPEFCMHFYLTKRVERQSYIIDGLFLFCLELYILNSAVI